jgi:hypothetical protein
VNKVYQKTIEQIKIDGENYANEGMKTVYKDQKEALDKVHAFVGKLYIKYAKDGVLSLTSTQKSTVTAELKTLLKSIGSDLTKSEVGKTTDILKKVYEDTYYKSAYVMDTGGSKK